jgi:hypothetical protein
MSIYDVNYLAQAETNIPPSKRKDTILDFLDAMLSVFQFDHDNYFTLYRQGSGAARWDSATTFADEVYIVGSDGAVYQSLQATNTGNDPTHTVNQGVWWVLVSPNFVGNDERLKYTTQKITVEWALNKWFGTTFRQPPGVSDIFIARITPSKLILGRANQDGLCRGGRGNNESYMNSGRKNVVTSYNTATFSVNAPNALQVADSDFTNKLINYTQKFTVVGITFTVILY